MAVKKLTDVTMRALKAPKTGRLELWDSLLPGFGVRVTDKDARSFFVMYRAGAGGDRKQKRLKIGDAKILDLATARERAREALRQAQAGVDPSAKVKAAEAPLPLFRATAIDYLERYVDANTRGATPKEWRRIFEVVLIPEFNDRPLESITRYDIEKLLDKFKKAGKVVYANRLLARLKHFFAWCIDRELCDANPAARFKPAKETARDRALTEPELRWFAKACDDIGDPFGGLFLFLLLTAQRRDEAATMEWTEVDFGRRLWTIPKEKAKNGAAHEVALSDQAMAILNRMAKNRISERYVFSTNGKAPVSGFSVAKRRLNSAFEKHRRIELALPEEAETVERFTLHDLRRSASTGMAGLGVAPHVVEKILNHTGGTIRGVAAIYNRFAYAAERREALEKWGAHVAAIATA